MFTPNDTMIYVYELPEKLTDGFAFGGGRLINFKNVDWFNGHDDLTREGLEAFIGGKLYYTPDRKFLVLSSDQKFTFQM